ncbi:hypothetical protein CAPTEDRAFT_223943 [Capitella teleta]|uniref:C1q domain-containing protein n=1 Tax=Capitella teleta TaxID=283909 RepID=R7UDE9_CAPTE|nr:hypothetical protein CAPTEDRAFT_223943 [Capitella teleta]|eukprot:ELU01292.1 hypothetical protein CAPTEDRAFT_223943 [Capitella teleta]
MKFLLVGAVLLTLGYCSANDPICEMEEGVCLDKRYAHPECSKYYRCFSAGPNCTAYVFDCPDGLHFSPSQNDCLNPVDANCTDSTTPTPTDLTTQSTTTNATETTSTTTPETTTPSTTAPSTTPAPGPDGVSAFSVSRSVDWHGGQGDVSFDTIGVNLGGCFKDGTTFEPGRAGVYFMSFSGGIPPRTPANIKIRPTNFPNYPSTIYRESTTHEDHDMMYRNFLAEMADDAFLTYRAFEATVSSHRLESSFSGFSLTDMFSDVQAFYVARENSFHEQGRIEMLRVFMDTGNNYNMSGREFVAPEAGVYYFFFGSGQEAGIDNRVALRSWENALPETEAELWVHSTSHNGLDMATRGTMLELNAGQSVWVTLMENSVYSDADINQIYFGGFLYKPRRGPSIAFAVHRTKSWQSVLLLDPVPFEEIEVNQGNAFDAGTNTVVIPTSGYYYIELSVGTLPFKPLDVEMLVNGEPGNPINIGDPLASVIVRSSNHSHVASSGRSLVTHLQQNDVLRLRAMGSTGIFSDLDKQTTWMGFLLYED